MITRTSTEIEKLYTEIQAELTALPETNAFGESNEGDRAEAEEIARRLVYVIAWNELPKDLDTDSEVYLWLTGKSNLLNIYLEL